MVLATGPNSGAGSGYGSAQTRNAAMGYITRKTRTIGNGPVLSPQTRHFKFTFLAPIKYLSSDRIMTWSVRRLCSFSFPFTSRCQVCDQTNIRWVAIENPPFSPKITCNFTAIQRILVRSQTWQREVKEQLKLHNLRTDHVMIRSKLKYLIRATFQGSVEEPWNGPAVRVQPGRKTPGMYPVQVTNPPRQCSMGFWPGNELNRNEPPVKTRSAGRLPGPVGNTTH